MNFSISCCIVQGKSKVNKKGQGRRDREEDGWKREEEGGTREEEEDNKGEGGAREEG